MNLDVLDTAIVDSRKAIIDSIFDNLDVSEQTRKEYKYRIKDFLEFVSIGGLSNNAFLEYKRNLLARSEISISTKNKYLAAARIFLKELNRHGKLPVDITQNVKGFYQDKKHKVDGISVKDMERICYVFQNYEYYSNNLRLKAVVGLLAYQGLRQIEIVRLDVKDIHLARKVALVRGKGRDDKEPIPLNPQTVSLLKEYIESENLNDGPLFYCLSGPNTGERLTTRGLRLMVTDFLSDIGIEKTTHSFRHYFTTELIKAYKGDLIEVSHYTRHRSLEMLQVYNDKVQMDADLPRFYSVFNSVSFR